MTKEQILERCSDCTDDANLSRIINWPSDFGEVISLKNLPTPRYSKPILILSIDEGVKEIPKEFLSNSGCFCKVIIPASVEKIGSMAFYKAQTISNIEFKDPYALKEIGDGAFAETAIRFFEGPNVTKIGAQSFMNCSVLESISFQSLEKVPLLAFAGDASLCSIDIPKVSSISARAFYECGFSTFIASSNLTDIGPFAFANGNLETVDLSQSSVEVIEMGAFMRNVIKDLKLPDSWEIIKSQAFQDNELESLSGIKLTFEGIIVGDAFDKGVIT